MKHEKNLEWQTTLDALSTTHTLSVRMICNMLKASRSWVNDHVTYRIEEDKIYLPCGRGNTLNKKNWIIIAAKTLNRPSMTEANWFNRSKFMELIGKSISSVSRQTIKVPVEVFVKDKDELRSKYNEYEKAMSDVQQRFFEEKSDKLLTKYNEYLFKQQSLWREMVDEDLAEILGEGDCTSKGRSKVERTPVEKDVLPYIEEWVSPHDIKGYGDTDEEIFRNFFAEGYYRIELELISKKGKPCRKVFYLKDDNMMKHAYVDQYIAFDYSIWKILEKTGKVSYERNKT